MKTLRLLLIFCKLGILSEVEYRANFLVHLFESIMSFATGITVLWAVFSKTNALGGWSWDELLVVLALWFITKGLVNVMIAPSIRQFMFDVWQGNLDYMLTKPANHQFMASSRKFLVFFGVDIAVGIVILITALLRLHLSMRFQELSMVVISLLAGGMILYGFWVVLGTLSIWTVKLENLMLVFYAMFEAGRWPAGLYPGWLRYSLTFLVPIAFAITVPAEAVIGRLTWQRVLVEVFAATLVFFASKAFFNYGVKKRYTGASA